MKKKMLSLLLCGAMISALVGCGGNDTPSSVYDNQESKETKESQKEDASVNASTESNEMDKTEEVTEEEASAALFENLGNDALIQIVLETLDNLNEVEYSVIYEPWPTDYMGIAWSDGSENGGEMACRVNYGDNEFTLQYGEQSRYSPEDFDYCFEMNVSDYKDGYFHKMEIRKVSDYGNTVEVVETHEDDAYMKEFNEKCDMFREWNEEDVSEKTGTDFEKYNYAEELSVADECNWVVDGYNITAYKDTDVSDEVLYVEFAKDGYVVATIRDSSIWEKEEDFENGYRVNMFNYSGSILNTGTYTEESDYQYSDYGEEVYRYDQYGNCVYFEDICNLGAREYIPIKEDYSVIVYAAYREMADRYWNLREM